MVTDLSALISIIFVTRLPHRHGSRTQFAAQLTLQLFHQILYMGKISDAIEIIIAFNGVVVYSLKAFKIHIGWVHTEIHTEKAPQCITMKTPKRCVYAS